MDSKNPDVDDRLLAETPEDVAVLYSWANLQGAKYRDFSASRREYRAQMRKRVAETQREQELRAKAEAEASAAAAELAAREAEEAARFHENAARQAADERQQHEYELQEQARARALQHAAELSQRAAAERTEAARRAEAVAAAEEAARREAREMVDARASAERQAARYAESESRHRALTGPQPGVTMPGATSDPYTDAQPVVRPERIFHQPTVSEQDMKPVWTPRPREERSPVPQPEDSSVIRAEQGYWPEGEQPSESPGTAAIHTPDPNLSSRVNYYYEPDSHEKVAAVDQYAQFAPYAGAVTSPTAQESYATESAAPKATIAPRGYRPDESNEAPSPLGQAASSPVEHGSVPAWISPQGGKPAPGQPARFASSSTGETLQHSRERVAARWFALKGVFDQGAQEYQPEAQQIRQSGLHLPILSIFSLAGGVGKTSLVATLGRALSSLGEKVLLADTTSHGLLPFYFGANELRPGVVRTFSPPSGSNDASIALVSYDLSQKNGDPASQEWFTEELTRHAQGMQRIVLDLSSASSWAARRLARMNSVTVVPVAPDMNSVISLGPVDKFFAGIVDADGRPIQPVYLLNQFDASLPLHLDVREVMRQQLGDRLLPFVIRRSPTVSEALAEGMTVMDYAPEAPVAGDYMNLASWLRAQSLPATTGFKNARWSER